MFMLAMNLHEAGRQILERPGRRQVAVDERATPALRRDLAADQQVATIGLENRFNGGGVGAGTDEVAGRPAAEQQADCLHED